MSDLDDIAAASKRPIGPAGRAPPIPGNVAAIKTKKVAYESAAMPIGIDRTKWFYLELVSLAIPAGLYIYRRRA
jgi:hypothetical protein